MNKKVVVMFLFICAIGIFATGCTEVPKEVKENMKNYGTNEQKKEETKITYCKPEELKNTDLDAIKSKKYGLPLPEKIDFSNVENVSQLEVKIAKNYIEENKQKYVDLFGGDINKFKDNTNQTQIGGKIAEYDDSKLHLGIRDNGGFVYCTGDVANNEMVKSEVLGMYHIEDSQTVSIEFASGAASLQDMCDKAQKWYEKHIGSQTLDYKITDAIARKVTYPDKTEKHLALAGEFFYKGLVFNNHYYYSEAEEGENYYCNIPLCTQTEYEDIDEMTWFSVNNMAIEVVQDKPFEKIVDFDSAVRIVCDKLSGFRQFQVDDVVLMYDMQTYVDGKTDPYKPGKVLTARPFYLFLVKGAPEQDDGAHLLMENYYTKAVMVDMITGEFISNLPQQ